MADEEVVSVKLVSENKQFIRSFNEAADAVGNVTKAGIAMGKGFATATRQVQDQVSQIGQQAKRVAMVIAGVGVSTGIMAGLGLKNFASMQTAMANVATVTDTTKVSVMGLQNTLMKMSANIPKSAEELAAGLYEVQSAGFQGAEALKVMEATSKFAVAGIVDMGTSVRATTGLMNAYGISADNAMHITDVLFKAVEEGQMTASEFAINIGDWASSASSLGISMESAAAALAVMTTRGAMPANLAATSLNSMMRNLIRPTEAMTDALKRMGFDSGKAALNTLGFAKTLGELWKQAGKNETKFADMFQDVEGFRGALGLVTKGYEKLLDTQARFNNRAMTDGTTERAFAKQIDTLGAKLAIFRNEMRKFSYEIGKLLAPVAEMFLNVGTAGLKALNSLPQPIRTLLAGVRLLLPALTAVGVALGVMVVKARLTAMVMAPALNKIAKFAFAAGNATGSTTIARALGSIGMAFEKIGAAGGPIAFAKLQVTKFAAANAALRMSMIRTAATVGAFSLGFVAAAVAIGSLVSSMGEAKSKAESLKGSLDKIGTGGISSMADLNAAFEEAVLLNNQLFNQSGGNGFWNSALASLQMITPFTENTKINALAASDAIAGLAREYQVLYQYSAQMSRESGASIDSVLSSLSTLQQEGSISISTLMDQYQAWVDMTARSDVAAYERAVATSRLMADALGVDAEEVDPFEFMSQETYQEYIMLNDSLKITEDRIKELAERTEDLKVISTESGVAAARLAEAVFKIGDEASTAEDKLDAFKTIVDEIFGTELSERDILAKMAKNVSELGLAMKEEGGNFDLWTEGGQKIQAAMSGAGESFREYLKYLAEHNGPNGVNLAAQEVINLSAQIQAMGQDFGWSSDQISQMLTIMGLTPENIQTYVDIPGIDQAIAELLQTGNLLTAINGYVANAGVVIRVQTVSENTAQFYTNGTGPLGLPADVGSIAQNAIKGIQDALRGTTNFAPKSGGGGGGGGGSRGWTMSSAQAKNMRDALATPLLNILNGELGAEWQKLAVTRWYDAVTKNMFMEGKTRLGAGILRDAQASGSDPSQEFEDMVEEYGRLVKLVGKNSADMAINQFDTLDSFSAFVDRMEELINHQRDVEDWKYTVGRMGYAEYKAILESRLATYEEFSDEWMDLTDQLKDVQADQLAEEDRMMQSRLELEEVSKEEYLVYLKQRLIGLEKYSEEWMQIWREISSAEEELIQQQEDRANGIQDFADAVADAFQDIKRSVEEPIVRATSLLSAFGDQANITQDQVTGFYQHMLEGTQRWVAVIRELKAKGVNGSFLNDLIQAGPQSLSFAEGVLALGTDGIGFINDSMNEISSLAGGLGVDIARGQVGTLVQNNNSVTITVGDITVSGEFQDGITLMEVQEAIEVALGNVAVNVQNRQVAPPPTVQVGNFYTE